MRIEIGWYVGLNLIKEGTELDGIVPRHVAIVDAAGLHIESSKEVGRTRSAVIMVAPHGPAGPQGLHGALQISSPSSAATHPEPLEGLSAHKTTARSGAIESNRVSDHVEAGRIAVDR